jgi:septum formation inhibitor MinC
MTTTIAADSQRQICLKLTKDQLEETRRVIATLFERLEAHLPPAIAPYTPQQCKEDCYRATQSLTDLARHTAGAGISDARDRQSVASGSAVGPEQAQAAAEQQSHAMVRCGQTAVRKFAEQTAHLTSKPPQTTTPQPMLY